MAHACPWRQLDMCLSLQQPIWSCCRLPSPQAAAKPADAHLKMLSVVGTKGGKLRFQPWDRAACLPWLCRAALRGAERRGFKVDGGPTTGLEAAAAARPCKGHVSATGLSSIAEQAPQRSPAGHRCSQAQARSQPVLPAERACSCGSCAEQGCTSSMQELLQAGCPAAADVGCVRSLIP